MQQRFLLQILLFTQHVSGTTIPIISSSRVLYSGCCLWYFVLLFSSSWSGVELRVMCPVCRMLQYPANRTHNPDHWPNEWFSPTIVLVSMGLKKREWSCLGSYADHLASHSLNVLARLALNKVTF